MSTFAWRGRSSTNFILFLLTFILSLIQQTKIGLTQRRSLRNELTSWRLAAREASMEAENETEVW